MTESLSLPWDVPSPFIYRYTVCAEDIDILGHANNARYLVWLEKAAWEHSSAVNLGWDRYQELGVAVVARRTEMDYIAEALEVQSLQIGTWISENRGRATMWRSYQIIREADQVTLMRARTQWAVVNLGTGRPCKQPDAFLEGYAETAAE